MTSEAFILCQLGTHAFSQYQEGYIFGRRPSSCPLGSSATLKASRTPRWVMMITPLVNCRATSCFALLMTALVGPHSVPLVGFPLGISIPKYNE